MSYTWEVLYDQVQADYQSALGREILTDWVQGYDVMGESTEEEADGLPFRVIVDPTPKDYLTQICDGWVDPQWCVHAAPGETRISHIDNLWVYGTSYRCNGETQGHWRLAEPQEVTA